MRRATVALALSSALLIACGSADTPQGGASSPSAPSSSGATSITANGGNNQAAPVGTALPTNPSVLVRDASGRGVAGVVVTFAVAGGGGSVSAPTQTTSSSGIATSGSWTLGTTVGAQTLTATATGLTGSPVTFVATAAAPALANLLKVAGDNQTAQPETAVSATPSVRAVDANGNPVAGVTVTFAVTSGGGRVTGASQVTNSVGVATIGSWLLGSANGAPVTNTLTAAAGTLSTSFSASLPLACTRTTSITLSTTISGTFPQGLGSCRVNGLAIDFYSVAIPDATHPYRVSRSSTINSDLYLSSSGTLIAQDVGRSFGSFGAYLTAGTYQFFVLGSNAGESGSYSISIAPISSTPTCTGGDLFFMMLSATVWTRQLQASCLNSEFVQVYLPSSRRVTMSATSSAFTPRLLLFSPTFTQLLSSVNTLTDITVSASGIYTLQIASDNNRTGTYSLYLGPP